MEHRMDMPAAGAAKLVKREVLKLKDGKPVVDKDGKPTGETELVAVKADEILSTRVCEVSSQVIAVTIDGQKLSADIPAGKSAKKGAAAKDGDQAGGEQGASAGEQGAA
jgi:hypothetical protein